MWEVEQKFHSSGRDMDKVPRLLDSLGAVRGAVQIQVDTYFAHPARDFRDSDEALRIRHQTAADSTVVWLTYKGPRLPGPTKTRRELETRVIGEDAGTLAETLQALGFQLVATVSKLREPFGLLLAERRFQVCLDQVKGLGFFLEVETIVADRSLLDEARAAVLEVARMLDAGAVERRSYLGMLLEQEGDS